MEPPCCCALRCCAQALTPLTIGRSRWTASALGALWGFGHSTGQLILGLVMVLLKVGGRLWVASDRWLVLTCCRVPSVGGQAALIGS